MILKKFRRAAAGTLALTFTLAAAPIVTADQANAACRTFNPQPASIVIDAKTGAILAENHIDKLRYPASLTKMMTALLIFEALRDGKMKLDDKIKVKLSPAVKATYGESFSKWLKEGTELTVKEAILAIVIASANNVAVIMGEQVSGTNDDFIKLMNKKAQALGMDKTVFTNASGLPDKKQVSTARDIAKLALHIYKEYPEYYHFFSARSATFGPRRKGNHNRLVMRNNYIDGLKTGFICDSGFNVAISATKNKNRVVTVVFGGRTTSRRDQLAKKLTDNAFRTLSALQKKAETAGTSKAVPHINGGTMTFVRKQIPLPVRRPSLTTPTSINGVAIPKSRPTFTAPTSKNTVPVPKNRPDSDIPIPKNRPTAITPT